MGDNDCNDVGDDEIGMVVVVITTTMIMVITIIMPRMTMTNATANKILKMAMRTMIIDCAYLRILWGRDRCM